jgi:large exoprotein involved in heme utilization and adhesion
LNPVTQLTGNAGNVTVITDTVSLSDRATINVSNLGTGDGGNVDIRANTVQLDNRAVITATVTQGKQANITIQAQDLQLRRNSLITTNASSIIRTDAGDAIASDNPSSNGGNVTINTNTLVALENSDITANSQQAFGGRVTINAQGLFGTQVREQNTLESDITSAGGRPELRGTVEINTPTVNSVSELVQLPENFTDASNQIATGCAADQGNSFTLTGRGGLAEDPSQTLRGRTVWRDLRPLVGRGEEPVTRTGTHTSRGDLPIPNPQSSIVEAQGWMINVKGQVELVANASQLTLQTSQFRPTDCRNLVN